MFLVVLLALAVAAAVVWSVSRKGPLAAIPRLPPDSILGNHRHLFHHERHRIVHEEKPGSVFRANFAGMDLVFAASGTAAGVALREATMKPMPLYAPMKTWSGMGAHVLQLQTGQEFKRRAALYRTAFAPSAVKKKSHVTLQHLEELSSLLQERIDAAVAGPAVVDMRFWLETFSADNIFHTLFEWDLGSLRGDELSRPAVEAWNVIFGEEGCEVLMSPILPHCWWDKRVKALNKAGYALEKYLEMVYDDFCRRYEAASDEEQRGMEDLMMYAFYKVGKTMSKSNVLADIALFINAGHDTSAHTLTFLLDVLGKNPDVLARVHAELGASTGPEHECGPYLEACIKETMRLFPVAGTLNFRENHAKDLVLDGYVVPKKTPVVVWSWLVHRDKATWGEDADSFRPERFLEHKHLASPAVYAGAPGPSGEGLGFIPFASGPRICMGMNSGLQTIKMSAALLLRRFNFDPVDRAVDPSVATIVVRPRDCMMRLTSRA